MATTLQSTTTRGPYRQPPDDSSNECRICSEPCAEGSLTCSGSEPHSLCSLCAENYIRNALQRGGEFDRVLYKGGDENAEQTSGALEIPCVHFVDPHEPCDCSALSFAELMRVLWRSPELVGGYEEAQRRFRENNTHPMSNIEDAEVPSEPSHASPVEEVRFKVEEAKLKGGFMRCPECRSRGVKDEACMHIICETSNCKARWCYCCGRYRRRDLPEDCRGCDAADPHIEEQPGWRCIPYRPGELRGGAALYEFHRRIIRYFVQRIKQETPPPVWEEFRRQYPSILTGVPTEGRSIGWEELNRPEARRPPVFGNSVEADLLWKLPPLGSNLPSVNETGGYVHTVDVQWGASDAGSPCAHDTEPIFDLEPVSELITSKQGKAWLGLTSLTLLLLIIRWTGKDSVGLNTTTRILLSVVSYGAFSTALLYLSDYQTANRDSWMRRLGGRQLLGRIDDEEFPFLSRIGRWSEHRVLYVRLFVGGLAVGFLCVGLGKVVYHQLGVWIFWAGVTLVTFVSTSSIWLALVVNLGRKPDNQQDRKDFLKLVSLLFLWTLAWSLGLGFCQSGRFVGWGKILITLGMAGLLAEFTFRFSRGIRVALWERSMEGWDRVVCYLFLMGMSVGVVLVHVGNNHGLNAARIVGIVLIVTIGSSLCCYPKIRGF